MTPIDEYWNRFIKETGRSEEDRCAGDLNFEAKGFVGDELVTLVLGGQKTAFFTSWATYTIDQEPLPVSGELYVVLDRANNPRCVIETQSVEILPFNEVTWEMAQLEGEDENLQSWRTKHEAFKKNVNILKKKVQYLALSLPRISNSYSRLLRLFIVSSGDYNEKNYRFIDYSSFRLHCPFCKRKSLQFFIRTFFGFSNLR